MEKLETRIRNHDREIEKMCNFHYQGFVDSITELLKVRGEAQKLKVRDTFPLFHIGVLISRTEIEIALLVVYCSKDFCVVRRKFILKPR